MCRCIFTIAQQTLCTTTAIRYREFLRVYGGRVPPASDTSPGRPHTGSQVKTSSAKSSPFTHGVAGSVSSRSNMHNNAAGAIGGGAARVSSFGVSTVSEQVTRRREPSKPEGIDKKLSSPLAQVNFLLASIPTGSLVPCSDKYHSTYTAVPVLCRPCFQVLVISRSIARISTNAHIRVHPHPHPHPHKHTHTLPRTPHLHNNLFALPHSLSGLQDRMSAKVCVHGSSGSHS